MAIFWVKFAHADNNESLESADSNVNNNPIEFFADDIKYSKNGDIVTVSGDVQLFQGNRTLNADKVIYKKSLQKVEARGNVRLKEPDGSVYSADYMELKDDLKSGLISQFKALLVDKSRLYSTKAVREDDNITIMQDASYSPCKICKENPEKDPTWQIKASKATINEDTERMSYEHARLELYGVPVIYTPYLSHATPGAKRKSGLLTPSYEENSQFGSVVTIPYYYNIAANKDATITTNYSSVEGFHLEGEFRHMVDGGKYTLEGSITNPYETDSVGNSLSGRKIRGHIEGQGRFSIYDDWSLSFKGIRSTDDTYLRKYNYSDENVLTSNIQLEKIENRNYTSIESFLFQDVRGSIDPANTPLILPHVTVHKEHLKSDGSRYFFDASALSISRDIGVSTNHLSLKGSWEKPVISSSGHVFEFGASMRGDGYYVDNVVLEDNSVYDGEVGRIIPQAKVKWSYPLAKVNKSHYSYIEPIVMATWSPYGGNPEKIPNEDSQDVEFTDNNLFIEDHFAGIDRVEGGPRTSYGIRAGFFNDNYGDVDFLFGQSYRTKKDNNFSSSTGLDDNFSDYVGHVSYIYDDFFEAYYRFRLESDDFKFRKNQVHTSFDFSPVTFSLDYLSTDEDFFNSQSLNTGNREVVKASSSILLDEEWLLNTDANRNFEDGQWIDASTSLWFLGDCIDLEFSAKRVFTRDRDIRPSNEFFLKIFLKNLSY